jgi:hypothetical protein
MRRTTRTFAVAALAVASLFAAPSGASAETLACVGVNGVTGSLAPAVRALLNGGAANGVYTLAARGTCTFSLPPTGATMVSTGDFAMTRCSSGTWDGVMDVHGLPIPIRMKYHVDFEAGLGLIDITEVNGRPEQPGPVTPFVRDYDGRLTIVPSQGNCVNVDVTQWTITGDWVAVW